MASAPPHDHHRHVHMQASDPAHPPCGTVGCFLSETSDLAFLPTRKTAQENKPPPPPCRHSVDKEGTSQSSSCPALLLPPPSFDIHSHGHSGAHGPDFNSRLDNQRSGEYHVYCPLDGPKRCVDLGLCPNPESQLPS